VCLCSEVHRRTIDVQDFDRRRVPTRGLDDVLVSDELKGKLDKARHRSQTLITSAACCCYTALFAVCGRGSLAAHALGHLR
jgi:hypothetical protein